MAKEVKSRLQFKRDTYDHWKQAVGFIPKFAEPIWVTDKNQIFLGDGLTSASDLVDLQDLAFNASLLYGGISENSIEMKSTQSGAKGYYWTEVTVNESDATILLTIDANQDGAGAVTEEKFLEWAQIGSWVTIVNNAHYNRCAQIISATYVEASAQGLITLNSVPFTEKVAPDEDEEAAEVFLNYAVINLDYPATGEIDFGKQSLALGLETKAIGLASFAEGYDTVAEANGAHAEGRHSKAIGRGSHSEGYYSESIGSYSHAEGQKSIAQGTNAHAEGFYTEASGAASHAEGRYTVASANGAHSEGYQTKATAGYAHAEGQSTSALEANSHAEGKGTEASGNASHAEGQNTIAEGAASHAEGVGSLAQGQGAHAEGEGAIANGIASHGEGKGEANGNYAHAEGAGVANGNYSHAEGVGTAEGYSSHGEGSGAATVGYAHAEGQLTTASGIAAHAEGYKTSATKNYSHAEGQSTTASGENSHAEGSNTKASKANSHAEGQGTTASGSNSHAEGSQTTASGTDSHAEGQGTTASGANSHAEGQGTTASGIGAHAQGVNSSASARGAFASGLGASAQGEGSNALGSNVVAVGCQTVVGRWNKENEDAAFIVGIGDSEIEEYKNGLEVGYDGRVLGHNFASFAGSESLKLTASSGTFSDGESNEWIYTKADLSLHPAVQFRSGMDPSEDYTEEALMQWPGNAKIEKEISTSKLKGTASNFQDDPDTGESVTVYNEINLNSFPLKIRTYAEDFDTGAIVEAPIDASISGNAGSADRVNNTLTIGNVTFDGSAPATVTAANLGLSGAMRLIGETTTVVFDGSTTQTITLTTGESVTVSDGNVILYNGFEFVWAKGAWVKLGDETSFKIKQTPVSSPAASGTATEFISSITQNENGVISIEKKTVTLPSHTHSSLTGRSSSIPSDNIVCRSASGNVTIGNSGMDDDSNYSVIYGTHFSPYNDNVCNLGTSTSTRRFKDGFFAGTVYASTFSGNATSATKASGLDFGYSGAYATDNAGNFVAGADAVTWNLFNSDKSLSVFNVNWNNGNTVIAGNLSVKGTNITAKSLTLGGTTLSESELISLKEILTNNLAEGEY